MLLISGIILLLSNQIPFVEIPCQNFLLYSLAQYLIAHGKPEFGSILFKFPKNIWYFSLIRSIKSNAGLLISEEGLLNDDTDSKWAAAEAIKQMKKIVLIILDILSLR